MRLSICEFQTFQFVQSTNWRFLVATIWQNARFRISTWNIGICHIIKLHIQVSAIWLNQTFNLWNRNISICQIDLLKLADFHELTHWNFQFVNLKLWNSSTWPIETSQIPGKKIVFWFNRDCRSDFWRPIFDEEDRFWKTYFRSQIPFDKEDRFLKTDLGWARPIFDIHFLHGIHIIDTYFW